MNDKEFERHLMQNDKEHLEIKKLVQSNSKDITLIKDNHLAHIKEDIFEIKGRLNLVFVVAGILAPVAYFLMSKYL